MMKRFCLISLIMITAIVFQSGCATRTVARIGVDEVHDLSGRWNDTDSRLVSEQMIGSLMNAGWLADFRQEQGRKPTVIVGNIRNKSSEHIDTETFTKDIERQMINGGRIKFVASSQERAEVRSERQDQQSHSTEDTVKRLAAETGADFMIKGGIKTQIDSSGNKKVKFYQVDLELIDIENNTKVWMDTKKIKKFVKQSRAGW